MSLQNRNPRSERVLREMLATATELSRHGILSQDDLVQVRALCEPPPVYTPKRVSDIRTKKARMSQSVFAEFLNVSVSAVQKWESPGSGKHPTGAAARLLQVIEKKGVEAILAC
jgi:putative transcriptional regulator